jgi:hypothetical protein
VSATPARGELAALPRVHDGAGSPSTHLHGAEVVVAGVAVVIDCDGALYWPDEGILAVADLHLEKGSNFAARGVLLPPMTPRPRWHGLRSSSPVTRHTL